MTNTYNDISAKCGHGKKKRRFLLLSNVSGYLTWVKPGSRLAKNYLEEGFQVLMSIRKPMEMTKGLKNSAYDWAIHTYGL